MIIIIFRLNQQIQIYGLIVIHMTIKHNKQILNDTISYKILNNQIFTTNSILINNFHNYPISLPIFHPF